MKTTDIVQYLVRLDRLNTAVNTWLVERPTEGRTDSEAIAATLLRDTLALARQVIVDLAHENIDKGRLRNFAQSGIWN